MGSNHLSGGGNGQGGRKGGFRGRPPGPLGEDDDGIARTARHVAMNGPPTVRTYSESRPPAGPRNRFGLPPRPPAGSSHFRHGPPSHLPPQTQAGPSKYLSNRPPFNPPVRPGSDCNFVPSRNGGPSHRGPAVNDRGSGPSRQGRPDQGRVDRWTPSEPVKPAQSAHPAQSAQSIDKQVDRPGPSRQPVHPPKAQNPLLPPTVPATLPVQPKGKKKNKQTHKPTVQPDPTSQATYKRFSSSPPRRGESRISEEEAFNNAPSVPPVPTAARAHVPQARAPLHPPTPESSAAGIVKPEPGLNPPSERVPEKMKFVPKNPNRPKRLASPPIPPPIEDIKPDIDHLYGIDPSAPAIVDADRKEGVLGLARADIPPQCFSNNNAEREAARSKFRRVQKQKLAEQGRIPLNYLWRADGLGVEWKKAAEEVVQDGGGGKRRKVDQTQAAGVSSNISAPTLGGSTSPFIESGRPGPFSSFGPLGSSAATTPSASTKKKPALTPAPSKSTALSKSTAPPAPVPSHNHAPAIANPYGGPSASSAPGISAFPPSLPDSTSPVPPASSVSTITSPPALAPAATTPPIPASAAPTLTPVPADPPQPPSRSFDIPTHLSLQELEQRVLQGIMEIDTWTSLLEEYPQQRTRLSRQVERKQEEIFALTGLIRAKRAEGF